MAPGYAATRPNNELMQKVGFAILLAYFFVSYSRILDITVPFLHLPAVMAVVMYTATLLSGGIQRSLRSRAGVLLFAITAIMFFSIPFSIWRSNTLEVFFEHWMKTFPLFVAIAAMVYTTRQVERLFAVIAFALFCSSSIALARGDSMGGRLVISNSKFGDPNDLAMFCGMALMAWASIWVRTDSWLKRLPMMACMGLIFVAMMKTGSRGSFIGFTCAVAYVFWRMSLPRKAVMIAAVVLGSFIASLFVSDDIRSRYTTFFESDSARPEEDGTVGSTKSRLALLQQSIVVTLQNPLIGVGAGNFPVAGNELAISQGYRRGSWQVTHNMYTQISSELGIPAALMYIAVIVITWRTFSRIEKRLALSHPDPQRIAGTAFWLKGTLLCFSVSGFFLSVAYSDILPLMAGFGLVFEAAVLSEAKQKAAAPTPRPVPVLTGGAFRRSAMSAARNRF